MKIKLITRIISVVLVVSIIITGTISTAFAASAEYISEIKLVNAANFNKDEYTSKGWHVTDGEINAVGNDKKVLIYKTTKNRLNAITDVRLMNENGNYSDYDFKKALEKQTANVAQMVAEWEIIVNEFKANYKAGKIPAVYAKQLLDFYVEDDSCDIAANKFVTVGDVLVKDTYDKATISKILLEGNSKMVALIEEALVIGCSEVMPGEEELEALSDRDDFTPDMAPTWLFRVQSLTFDPSGFDSKRADIANMLLNVSVFIKETMTDYHNLEAKAEGKKMTVEEYLEAENKAVQKEIEEGINYDETTDTYDGQLELMKDSKAKDMYDMLSEYTYNKKGTWISFAEFFSQDNLQTYDFLPFANALTDGQARLLYYVGLEDIITYTGRTEEEWKDSMEKRIGDTADMLKAIADNIGDTDTELASLTEAERDDAEVKADILVKANKMSVYAGVNRAMFNQELAEQGLIVLTGDAQIKSAANNDQTWMQSHTKTDNVLAKAGHILVLATGVAFTPIGSVLLANVKRGWWIKKIKVEKGTAFNGLVPDGGQTVITRKVAYSSPKAMRVVGITLIIASAALIAFSIYAMVQDWKTKPVTHRKIPVIIVNHVAKTRIGKEDIEINKFVTYEVVYNEKDEPANINDNSVEQWYSMYVTKDENAGNPLLAGDIAIGDLTSSAVKNAAKAEEADKSFVSMKDFGCQGSANLSNFCGSTTAKPCYVYFKADTTAVNKNTASAFSTGYYAIVALVSAFLGAGVTYFITGRKKKENNVSVEANNNLQDA